MRKWLNLSTLTDGHASEIILDTILDSKRANRIINI